MSKKLLVILIYFLLLSCQSINNPSYKNILSHREVEVTIYLFGIEKDCVFTSYMSEEDILKELNFAEKCFIPLNLSLRVKEFIQTTKDEDFIELGKNNKNSITIYYGPFKINEEDRIIFGMGLLPPYEGIYINSLIHDKYTLAHELGHYFGLEHVFAPGGDFCDDTPEQNEPDPYGSNIMDYSIKDNLSFTSDQIKIIYRNLNTTRKNVLKKN